MTPSAIFPPLSIRQAVISAYTGHYWLVRAMSCTAKTGKACALSAGETPASPVVFSRNGAAWRPHLLERFPSLPMVRPGDHTSLKAGGDACAPRQALAHSVIQNSQFIIHKSQYIIHNFYASSFYSFRCFFADPCVSNTGMFFNLCVYLSLCLDGGIFGHGGGSPYAQHSHAYVYHFRHPLRESYSYGGMP